MKLGSQNFLVYQNIANYAGFSLSLKNFKSEKNNP